MKRIKEGEEFQLGLQVFTYAIVDSKIVMKSVRKGKVSKNEFIPPTLDEVKIFFKEKGYTEESAIKFYEYYSLGDWKDGKGQPVKNYKQKASSVWFRDENKIIVKSKEEKTESKFLF